MNILEKIGCFINEDDKKKDQVERIFDFFEENPQPEDSKVHALADEMGINTHRFEELIYFILGAFIGGGEAKKRGITEKDVDLEELKKGMKVELEHTTSSVVAKRIALDHLAEIPDYYTRLSEMENDE